MRFLTAALCAFAIGSASGAELYRWVDPDGVVHYDDKAHPQAKAIIVTSSNGPGADATALARAAECKKQQADLELYRNATGLQQVDALGNRKVFSERERLQFLEKQEQKVQEACGPAPAAPAPTSAPP